MLFLLLNNCQKVHKKSLYEGIEKYIYYCFKYKNIIKRSKTTKKVSKNITA